MKKHARLIRCIYKGLPGTCLKVIYAYFRGVDIGGTGIKAAVIETQTGKLISEHKRIPTPQPPPENIAISLAQLVSELAWPDQLAVVFGNCASWRFYSASNIDPSWINTGCTDPVFTSD